MKDGGRIGRWAVALALPLLLLAITSFSFTAGASEAINIFAVDDYHKQAVAGDGSSFAWVIFNNDTSPHIIQLEVTPSVNDDTTGRFNARYVALDPGASSEVVLNVETDRSMATTNVTFLVTFTITKMSDPNQSEVVLEEASLTVISSIGAMAGQNKIFGIWDNFLPSPLDGNEGAFIVSVIGWSLIALFFAYVIDPIAHLITRRTKMELDDMLLKFSRGPIFAIIIFYGIVNSLEILTLDRDLITQIEFGYKVVVILIIVWLLYKIYHHVVIFYAREYSKKTKTDAVNVAVPLLEKIGMVVIPLLGLMAIMELFGYDLTTLLAGVGFLGIVIGFAAQSTLANFFAGLQLLADRPFKVGDLIRLDNGAQCEVIDIGLRATELYDPNTQEKVVIPNNEIANKHIINMVEPNRNLTIAVGVGVAYGSDVNKVMALLFESAVSHPNVITTGSTRPVVRFSEFGESALLFKTFIPIDDVKNRFKVASEFRTEVNRRLNEAGIEIPFPQRVVHVKKD